jgi:hypothetical protein
MRPLPQINKLLDVVATHHHMTGAAVDNYFLHCRGTGPAEKLATARENIRVEKAHLYLASRAGARHRRLAHGLDV